MNYNYFESIKYDNNQLLILDQLLLPGDTKYIQINSVKEACIAITKMQIRGAPGIAVFGMLSIAIEMKQNDFPTVDDLKSNFKNWLQSLVLARPTAVNIQNAKDYFNKILDKFNGKNMDNLRNILIQEIEKYRLDDIKFNKQMANFGAEKIFSHASNNKIGLDNDALINSQNITLLTHCNTGSLATAGYGTALGVVRKLHEKGCLKMCYFTETRPYNQGSRLTSYELMHDNIPSILICDSMVAMLMSSKKITAVVVGADRIASNGDTANKIGTLQLAIVALHYQIPFYIVAPTTTIDFGINSGDEIKIEIRSPDEMLYVKEIRVAANGVECWNPAFDVTPSDLITGGVITEYGVFAANNLTSCLKHLIEDVKNIE